MIRTELIRARSELIENEKFKNVFFAIHNELLKSLVSSGDLSVFTASEAIALTLIYTRIDNYGKNIEMTNKRIDQLKYLVNPENPSYISLFRKLDESKEPEDKDLIEMTNAEIKVLKTYSEVNIGIYSESGIDYGRRLIRIIEAFLEQEWFKDEEKHYFFPVHMSESDEKIYAGLTKLLLVPVSA